ncbi:MAG: hypothetical protein OES32_18140 [Acidobacteriota bacterium]|nr:hypothetical protein [Acidobacteriota bacterium]
MNIPRRVLAVDWSGDVTAARKRIWLCEVDASGVRRLESGRSREELVEHLIAEAARELHLTVGLDFAFSFPAELLRKRAHRTIATVWHETEMLGEGWLEHCPFPFWGKPGRKKPPLGETLYRATELAVARETGFAPFSVLQIGGAGAVGVGSIRGMPGLRRLRGAGFSVWPFDAATLPSVVEIWPRLFIGEVRKSKADERADYLAAWYPELDPAVRRAAVASDDAFDALVSALEMYRHREELAELPRSRDATTLLEGEIWRPLSLSALPWRSDAG